MPVRSSPRGDTDSSRGELEPGNLDAGNTDGVSNSMQHSVFVTGGTGYMGQRLILLLIKRGHEVRALVRKGSESKLPSGAQCVIGDALRMDSYTDHVWRVDTFVHLIGVPH